MTIKLHTPYDGSVQPFTIGLGALDPTGWIEVDDNVAPHLAEKNRLLGERHSDVFQAEDDTGEAQREVLEALLDYLPLQYPALYQAGSGTVTFKPTDTTYKISDFEARPLELAARLIQDDLVLMRSSEGRHRLVAAVLCFPSGWSLKEKFGQAMADVHGPVPGFGPGSRNALLIERIFSNLKPGQPVERYNWSLFDEPRLYYPTTDHAGKSLVNAKGQVSAWIRIERQTLSKLPRSGDVLFTIKICNDPLGVLKRHPDGATLAASMRKQIEDLDAQQLAYKGLTDVHEEVRRELTLIEQAACADLAEI
ncbi:MAG: DUF3445 domain-containing protein [Rhizobiales bacterium]|nr:DUF3445 domain-containing protein [Hyphomicrobiales bacterium]